MEFIKNGASLIQNMIDMAVSAGKRGATVTGLYEIEKTVLIPSDFTLYLEDCHLKMATGTMCNMFTNASCRTEKGRTSEGGDRNIAIVGRGRAILDGGEYNGLSERNHSKDGNPHISVNNLILMANVDGFRMENLHLRNQRWWAMNFLYCCNGLIRDIDFLSDYTWVNEEGQRLSGLSLENYGGVYIKNSDGIDLRCGCHDILIENITGFTEDDTIALTACFGSTEEMYGVKGACPDLYNVIIRNVRSAALCSNIRLLNQGGTKLYNVLIDGMFDTSKGSPCLDRGSIGVRVGDGRHLYGSRHATADETYNITVRNVYSRAYTVLHVGGAMSNCCFENINGFDGAQTLIESSATVDITPFLK